MARCYSQGGFRLHAIFCLIAALGFTPACTSKKNQLSRGEGFEFFKNPDSNQACLQTNLSQWELSGAFVHKMLLCASNRSTDGGETLPATQNLLKSLDATKLQTLIDFALTPDASAVDQESRYPYLIALSMLLDRGLDDAQKAGLDLTSERLDELQGFLLSLDPDRLQKQISAWSRSGHLETLLAQMGLFLQALADDSLSALSREMLEGSKLGPHLLSVSAAVLGQSELMDTVDAALSAETMQAPDPASRATLLETWRQPLSVGTPQTAITSPPIQTGEGGTTFVKHLDQFSKGLSDDEIQRLSRFLSSFWDAYRNLPETERNSVSQRLARGLEQGLDQQQNPVQWMLSMAQDLSSMPTSDLNPIGETLGKLLAPENSPTLDGLRVKVWASRMHEELVNLLYQGGSVPGCGSLTIPGLKDLPRDNFTAYFNLMKQVTEPNASCSAQQAPLSAALESWSKVVIADANDTRPCDAPCVRLQAANVDATATKNYWGGTWQEPDAALIQRLVSDTLVHARQASEHDPYHLRNLGVARTAVSAAAIDQWIERWNKAPAASLQDLARWDTTLTETEPYRSLLMPDALETLLSLRITELQSLSEQFHELLPATGNDVPLAANQRAARIFAGAYSQGPLEQALRSKLPNDGSAADLLQDGSIAWPQDLQKTFAAQRGLYSHKLASFKFADAIFRNPEVGSAIDQSDIPPAGLGSTARYVKFDAQGVTSLSTAPSTDPDLIQPRQSVRMPVESTDYSAWGLWTKMGEGGPLGSKDLPPAQAQAYIDFYPQLQAAITDPNRWQDLTNPAEPRWNAEASPIDATFFDVQPYTSAQARLLTLYYLRQYHKLPNGFPQTMQVSAANAAEYKLGFFSAAALVKDVDLDFTLFARMFPQSFTQGKTVEEMSQQALTIGADGAVFGPTQFTPYNRVANWPSDADLDKMKGMEGKVERVKVLSSLNLLSTTEVVSRKVYAQPLIGVGGGSCFTKAGKPAACPIEITGADKAAAIASYNTFIADMIAQQYCPLISTDAFGPAAVWSARLDLRQANADTCRTARFTAAPIAEEVRFPAWLTKRILADIFTMGQKAELKNGLAQLPAALRYYKLGQDAQTADFAQQWLRSAQGNWTSLNAASQMRRQFYAFSFWAGQPDLAGSYLDVWKTKIFSPAWIDFTTALGEYDENHQPHDVIYRLFAAIIDIQKRNAASGQSVLRTVLDTFDTIAKREDFTEAAGHIFANYAMADNYDFAAVTLPGAAALYQENFPWDWNQPGLRLTKFFAQNEMLKTGSGLSKLFSPKDFSRFLLQLHESSLELGSPDQRSDLFARFLRETLDLGLLTDASQLTLSERWNQILHAWRFARFDANFAGTWDAMLAGLELPLVTTDGRPAASAGEILNQALPVILRQGTGLWALHQDSQPVPEKAFWSKLALNMVNAIQTQPLGARALSRFAADPHLGFIKGGIWIRGMNDATTRRNMTAALESVVAVSENLWHAALVESSDMLGRLSKALGYMSTHLVWKPDPANNAYRRFIDQLYLVSSEETLREDQIALLNSWLQKEDETEPSGSTLAAGSP